jgi:hypothetical protein
MRAPLKSTTKTNTAMAIKATSVAVIIILLIVVKWLGLRYRKPALFPLVEEKKQEFYASELYLKYARHF